jgi:RNA processing factor Prp31
MLILQAIGLLDDLDKELNTYAMRVREWYGWHFPEMTKIVADNIAYAKAVSNLLQVTPELPVGKLRISPVSPAHCVACRHS